MVNSLVKKSLTYESWYVLEKIKRKNYLKAYKLYQAEEEGFKFNAKNTNSVLIKEKEEHKGAPIFRWCELLMKDDDLNFFDIYRSQMSVSPLLSKNNLNRVISFKGYNLDQPDLVLRFLLLPENETFCKLCNKRVGIYPGEINSTLCLHCFNYVDFSNNI